MATKGASAFRPALDALPKVKNPNGKIQTKAFLDLCRLILPLIDKFGAAMGMVKADIGGNISRLDKCYESDPSTFTELFAIVHFEQRTGSSRGAYSNSAGLLWLTRAMDFITYMLKNLVDHPDWTLSCAAHDSYATTLKMHHGWVASGIFSVGLNLTPDKQTFMDKLGKGDVTPDMAQFVTEFSKLLMEIHEFLTSVGLDTVKST
eukprot:TRINITY_DN14213_c0_g1_i1.p1 TRINITY_DN14213_c0_g1~~TRINITY_DN14213_c0_g1_i1.p1  ORF type:complete len:214 (+),score=29.88 TRINITY_DN14213_c0_g1_i1:29-643(+)